MNLPNGYCVQGFFPREITVNKISVIELTSREINRYLKKHEKRKCICDERRKLFKRDKCMMRSQRSTMEGEG